MTTVGEANVIVRPVVADFRTQLAQQVNQNIGRAGIQIPVTPKLPSTAALSWERIAGGALVPVPITPTITPAGRQAFSNDIGGLRGLLLGGGQFAASRALGISGAAAGLFVFGKAAIGAVKSAATLEQELNVFQQVSGATAEQMARVREEARRLGADISLPAVSAGDAAQTMTELAKAGLNVNQVLHGTRGTLQLAAAAQLDFATAAELSANALNAFQLPGTQAVKVADLLAGAANAAQGNIADFGVGLSQSAAVAHQAGIPLSETVVFLTELAKAGISGSDAGTSLRVALLRLIAPTTQAKKIFNELGIEITDAQGNVRLDVFEQLRRSMERLEPATRNAALATIFGTDAVRAAAIFVRDGAQGHAELARQVERQGQAAQTAAARTKGLSGAVGGLVSNVETLGSDLGTVALPALTAFAHEAAGAVSDVDSLVVHVEKLGHRFGGFHLGPFGTVGKVVKDNVKNAVEAPFVPLHAGIDLMRGDFRGAAADAEKLVPGLREVRRAIQGDGSKGLVGFAGAGDRSSPQLDRAAAQAGQRTGEAFSKGIADGIKTREPDAIRAARQTLERARENLRQVVADGQRAIADTIRQGDQAIQAAALEAKQNLSQIGDQLAQQALELLDAGPLAKQIERLQARLNASQAGIERGRLRKSLRDAREELARAESAIAGGGGSAAQRAAEQDFLRPFREKVKDAQSALEEFNTQGTIDKLRARLDAQKARLQRTLDDLIARFNAGLLAAPDLNARVAAALQRNVGPMGKAGRAQGFAFRQQFLAALEGVDAQAVAIEVGPRTARTGAEPRVVSPAQAAAQAAQQVKDARDAATRATVGATRSVTDAVRALHTDEKNAAKTNTSLLKQIADQLRSGRPSSKPSSATGNQNETPRRARTGPR